MGITTHQATLSLGGGTIFYETVAAQNPIITPCTLYRKVSIMRPIDFANLKTGDIILDINPKDKTNPASQYVVLCTNGNNTATALNEHGAFIHLNLRDDGEIGLRNVRNLEYRTLTNAYHYTAEEAVSHDLSRRVNGITTLHKMLSNPRNNHALNIDPVAEAAENILKNLTAHDLYDPMHPEKSRATMLEAFDTLANIADAEAAKAIEKLQEAKEIITDYNTRMNTIIAEVTKDWGSIGDTLKTSWTSHARTNQGCKTVTLPMYCGYLLTLNSWDTGEETTEHAFYAHRHTPSRLCLSDPYTGEEVGYLSVSPKTGALYVRLKKYSNSISLDYDDYEIVYGDNPTTVTKYVEARKTLRDLTNERARTAGHLIDEVSDTWARYYHTTTPAVYLLSARKDPFYNGLAQRTIEDMNTINELEQRITRAITTWKTAYTTTINQIYSD